MEKRIKTLVLFGSAHRDGNTAYLVDTFLNKINADVTFLDCLDIKPCIDCSKCLESGKCHINDKLTRPLEDIDSYGLILCASPLYFNQPTPMLLSTLSRFQSLYLGKKKLNSKACIILTGGGGEAVNSGDAEKTLRIALRCAGITDICYIRSLHTDTVSANDDKAALAELNSCIKKIKGE